MAYLEYDYDSNATLSEVADIVGISPSELAKINNIPSPTPIYNKLVDIPELHGTILIPDMYNGRESFENRDRTQLANVNLSQVTRQKARSRGFYSRVGFASDGACFIQVGSKIYFFPCYPESFTDTRQASYQPQNPLGRSEPFQIYTNSGPRTVNVSFRMHREMVEGSLEDKVNVVDQIVAGVQSATYPLGYGDHIPPKVRLVLGNACEIEGIIDGQVSAVWSETIIDHRYQIVELSFSVTEVTGNPITSSGGRSAAIYGYNQTLFNSSLV